ncbi:trans-sialidase [Trypanosoma cruzi cruzi]|uniref:Putative trans-sialidase, Group V n=1 Tax=Trypanosoma cruzi TaxID=5693 RepID=A0A2V2UT75_TRYCR|nr:trans-sialidase [Trypanosoma cruzi cruzi]PWU87264.1 putative trans-sialidase, Group V [Trypanosoma cruzi]
MLSRVAAVKAPRTHNRRRVTGSSGRRREGGESEPQRPNMSRRVITSAVLLLVVMMCCGTGGAKTEEVKLLSDPKFKWKGITEGDGVTVDSLGAPSLLKVGSDVFAVAEVQCGKGDGSFTGVASQLLTKKTTDKPEEVLKDAKDGTQFLEEDGSEVPKKKVDVSRPTTAVKGNDIYILVGKYGSKVAVPGPDAKPDAAQLGLLLVKGSVNSGEDTSNNKIDWKDNENPPQRLFDAQLGSWTRLIGSGGSGVKMEDETLVFPVEGTKKKAEDSEEEEKTVSLIIYSTDNTNWTLSKGMSDGGCSDPSVVEWEEDKLMMMTACDDGRRRVYESGDKGASWTEALGTLSRVWGNRHTGPEKGVGSGFITANIVVDGGAKRNVMLVTLPAYAEEGNKKGKLHLWLTDNTHIVYIGPVSEKDDDAAASSLLYKSAGSEDNNDELIALYEKKKDVEETSHSLWSVLLTEQLERVKKVLAAWKKADDRVSQLCATLLAQEERASTDTDCDAVKITDGLVGFLSDKFSDGIWRDEYLGVNATAKNGAAAATGTSDGVKFTGAWAEWPVGRQGENQLYRFANYNFTLVATVSIHNVPKGNIPLMGVRAGTDGETKLMELSYDSEKKWQLLCGDGNTKELGSIGETDTPQHVVILLKNGTQCTTYVDVQRVGDAQCELGSGESKEISHFYIGGDGDGADDKESRGDVSVTVTNVLLYNRPWDDTEIGAFNPNKADILVEMDRPVEGDAIQFYPGGGKEEPRQLLGSSGTGGISTPTVSSATTSSGGGKESVMQVVSEKSSDGHKNVGGGSFSDGDPTVETREEGTDGQEEEVNTQVREVNATALSSSLGNVPQGNNSDAGTMRGSGMVPSLLLLLLGLLGLAAL